MGSAVETLAGSLPGALQLEPPLGAWPSNSYHGLCCWNPRWGISFNAVPLVIFVFQHSNPGRVTGLLNVEYKLLKCDRYVTLVLLVILQLVLL